MESVLRASKSEEDRLKNFKGKGFTGVPYKHESLDRTFPSISHLSKYFHKWAEKRAFLEEEREENEKYYKLCFAILLPVFSECMRWIKDGRRNSPPRCFWKVNSGGLDIYLHFVGYSRESFLKAISDFGEGRRIFGVTQPDIPYVEGSGLDKWRKSRAKKVAFYGG